MTGHVHVWGKRTAFRRRPCGGHECGGGRDLHAHKSPEMCRAVCQRLSRLRKGPPACIVRHTQPVPDDGRSPLCEPSLDARDEITRGRGIPHGASLGKYATSHPVPASVNIVGCGRQERQALHDTPASFLCWLAASWDYCINEHRAIDCMNSEFSSVCWRFLPRHCRYLPHCPCASKDWVKCVYGIDV
jgi:hypothetical protein